MGGADGSVRPSGAEPLVQPVERRIGTPSVEQLLMGAELDHPAVRQDGDPVGQGDCGERWEISVVRPRHACQELPSEGQWRYQRSPEVSSRSTSPGPGKARFSATSGSVTGIEESATPVGPRAEASATAGGGAADAGVGTGAPDGGAAHGGGGALGAGAAVAEIGWVAKGVARLREAAHTFAGLG